MRRIQNNLREIQIIGKGTRERIVHSGKSPALRRLGIKLLGLSQVTSGDFCFCREHPNMLQVLVVLNGSGWGWMDSEWRPLQTGSVYLTPPDALHAYEVHKRWEIGWCTFEPTVFENAPKAPSIREVNPTLWSNLLSGLCEESLDPRPTLQLDRWVELLYHECGRLISDHKPRKLWKLWNEVGENLQIAWTLQILAKRAGMSEETLRVECQNELKQSPMAHLTRLRMQYAIALLETGRKVDAVASLVGYENPFAFSTAFRRVMGVPPSTIRKENNHARPS